MKKERLKKNEFEPHKHKEREREGLTRLRAGRGIYVNAAEAAYTRTCSRGLPAPSTASSPGVTHRQEKTSVTAKIPHIHIIHSKFDANANKQQK